MTMTNYTVIPTQFSVDNVTVEHSGGVLQVKDVGISTAKIAANAVTGAKIAMGSDAAGDTLYYNGTDYVRLAKGTAYQQLEMNAGATAPNWASHAVYKLVEDKDTSAGAATSYTFSSLDLDTDGYYELKFYIKSAASGSYELDFNGDSTDTNYTEHFIQFIGATIQASIDGASHQLIAVSPAANEEIFGTIRISRGVNGFPSAHVECTHITHTTGAVQRTERNVIIHESAANVTSIGIRCSAANNIMANSKLTLYKLMRV